MNNLSLKEKIEKGLAFLYLMVLSFIIAFQNTDSIFGNGETWMDASVYKYVAWTMDLGGMPYKDAFDHKGPLVYIFFWIGRKFGDWRGVWVPYVILIFVSLLLLYKIIRMFCPRLSSCILMLVVFVVMFDYEITSMSPEGISIPFMAGGLYIFLDYFLNSKISKLRLILCGWCFGCILMIKAQMISVWLVFCIAVLIKCIVEKKIQDIWKFLLYFIIGCLISMLPIIIWLIQGGAFGDFIADYIEFNSLYAAKYAGDSQLAVMAARIKAMVFFANKPMILLAMFCCCAMIWWDKQNRGFNIAYLLFILCSIALSALSGYEYGHYGTALIVAVTYPMAYITGKGIRAKEDTKRLLTLAGLAWVICIYAMPITFDKMNCTMSMCKQYLYNQNVLSPNMESVVRLIQENSEPDDLITVYGLNDVIYGLANRRSVSKYTFQHAFPTVDPERMDEYYSDLEENPPKLIVDCLIFFWKEERSRMMDFIEKHGYELVGTSVDNTHSVYKLPL